MAATKLALSGALEECPDVKIVLVAPRRRFADDLGPHRSWLPTLFELPAPAQLLFTPLLLRHGVYSWSGIGMRSRDLGRRHTGFRHGCAACAQRRERHGLPRCKRDPGRTPSSTASSAAPFDGCWLKHDLRRTSYDGCPYDDNRLLLILQVDHSRVTGWFAAHWGNDTFARPSPYAAMVLAAQEHDTGWWDWEIKAAGQRRRIAARLYRQHQTSRRQSLAGFLPPWDPSPR